MFYKKRIQKLESRIDDLEIRHRKLFNKPILKGFKSLVGKKVVIYHSFFFGYEETKGILVDVYLSKQGTVMASLKGGEVYSVWEMNLDKK